MGMAALNLWAPEGDVPHEWESDSSLDSQLHMKETTVPFNQLEVTEVKCGNKSASSARVLWTDMGSGCEVSSLGQDCLSSWRLTSGQVK